MLVVDVGTLKQDDAHQWLQTTFQRLQLYQYHGSMQKKISETTTPLRKAISARGHVLSSQNECVTTAASNVYKKLMPQDRDK